MSNVCAFENLLIVRKGKAKWGKEYYIEMYNIDGKDQLSIDGTQTRKKKELNVSNQNKISRYCR